MSDQLKLYIYIFFCFGLKCLGAIIIIIIFFKNCCAIMAPKEFLIFVDKYGGNEVKAANSSLMRLWPPKN